MARTLISLVAGAFDVDFIKFIIYSTIGIAIWNCAIIYLEYGIGHLFLE